ncbi:Solute carrier 2 (Facilitated glucose transporter) member 8 [Halocaridina rubra]|uniref:Solute carrier 2 (Facilitated glucose transporter) member 8 n=1 Tax=Halocaridina rubra TaxID=373956 RepID=A0AAN8X2Z6_HALRR
MDYHSTTKTSIGSLFSATLSTMAAGALVGYTSPALLRLMEPISPADGSFRLTSAQANWFSSVTNLSAVLGSFAGGYSMNRIGRKTTIILNAVVYLVGWILVGAAQSFGMLMAGRVVGGIAFGVSVTVTPAFIGETALADIRGALASLVRIMGSVGNVWGYAFGALIPSWRWLASVMAIPPLLCGICMFFVKETPLYLLSKSKVHEAKRALKFYRGKNYDCVPEMESLQQYLEVTLQSKASKAG